MTGTPDAKPVPSSGDETHARICCLLRKPSTYRTVTDQPVQIVHEIETHGARIFLAGDVAVKIKRPVKLPYLDFSTATAREAAIRREFDINKLNAPECYVRVAAICETSNGTLTLCGDGKPLEWAVLMRRFPAGSLLSEMAMARNLPADLGRALGDMIHAMHARLAPVHDQETPSRLIGVLANIVGSLETIPALRDAAHQISIRAHAQLSGCMDLLMRRIDQGLVRRCHGDLHLANLVWLDDHPVAFDAIEFDELLATIDVLYDLAFPIMELERYARHNDANALLNRWLWRSGKACDLDGLQALGVFLALRAGVRAMVAIDHARQSTSTDDATAMLDEAAKHTARALAYLTPPPPALIVVGGLSGTGKSTLARALAPTLGAAPGALHLRSDLERKTLAGVEELTRLSPEAYSREITSATYARLAARAKLALAADHTVICDAVYARSDERAAIEQIAAQVRVPFLGLWLVAPGDVMTSRVESRRGDASDATADIVKAQIARGAGDMTWQEIEAGDCAATTQARAERAISARLARHIRVPNPHA